MDFNPHLDVQDLQIIYVFMSELLLNYFFELAMRP